MAVLEVKFSMGDRVYHASTIYSDSALECPDCLGTLKWIIKLPSGKDLECNCKTCQSGYGCSTGFVTQKDYKPLVRTLTIGQVGFENGQGRYMCEETGIGSGTLYYDDTLFSTYEEAKTEAEKKTVEQMKHVAKNNFQARNSFANKLETLGYTRAEALEQNRKMKRWLDLIKEVE